MPGAKKRNKGSKWTGGKLRKGISILRSEQARTFIGPCASYCSFLDGVLVIPVATSEQRAQDHSRHEGPEQVLPAER
jgi:hypothetical protein